MTCTFDFISEQFEDFGAMEVELPGEERCIMMWTADECWIIVWEQQGCSADTESAVPLDDCQ